MDTQVAGVERHGGVWYVKEDGKEIVVSQHAIDRYRMRTCTKDEDALVAKHMVRMLAHARPAKFVSEKYRVMALLSHGLDESDTAYFIYNTTMTVPFVFVVLGNVIKTVHCNETNRWVVDNRRK